jgi:hypothetical protein
MEQGGETLIGRRSWSRVTPQHADVYGRELLAPRPTPKLKDTSCRPSSAPYSIYLPLLSISGGHLVHQQLEDKPFRGDKCSVSMVHRVVYWNHVAATDGKVLFIYCA